MITRQMANHYGMTTQRSYGNTFSGSGGNKKYAKKYYATAVGQVCNVIHETWPECQANTKGLVNARYKSFPTRQEAEAWLQQETIAPTLFPGTKHERGVQLDVNQDNMMYMYTDGSYAPTVCPLTGATVKKGGWGVVFVWKGQVIQEWNGYVPYEGREVGSDVAELYAIGMGLLGLAQMDYTGWHTRVRSDSEYGVKALNGRIEKWKRDGWLTAAKKPIANRVLIEALDNLRNMLSKHVSFEHVFGHDVDQFNKRADHIANAGRERGQPNETDLLLKNWANQHRSLATLTNDEDVYISARRHETY